MDIEDILLHPQFITTSHNQNLRIYSSLCYEEEIIFLNKHPKGWMTFKTSDIYSINKLQLNQLVDYVKGNRSKYEREKNLRMGNVSKYVSYIPNNEYYLMVDTKVISFHSRLNKFLNSLSPMLKMWIKKQMKKSKFY
ncbi:hypothetical protein COJ70_24270 [Priestia megaterium]|uniref:hypothetical protein n=1 Tax=Priestia megaterium TaxID=1404 RepID=UPI000BF9B63C|nr:hypothetical protein [Priestia megaterium]PFO12689.1 hypothetical protein COJ70_24270 [Priestia megaterium]